MAPFHRVLVDSSACSLKCMFACVLLFFFMRVQVLRYPASMEIKNKMRIEYNLTLLRWDWQFHHNIANRHWDYNREVADTSIIEMMMLAKTNLFVGQSTSNFFRFALELKSASCDCVPVFYSLDSPWCFDFAARAGKNVFSSSQGSESNWMC